MDHQPESPYGDPPADGDSSIKRGPGRPPKKMPAPVLRKDGIVETPDNPDNALEFVYENPTVLKSLFSYFKNLKTVDIHVRCAPEGLTFFARDSSQTCKVIAMVPGHRVNHYFCHATFWIGINRECVERIFSSIDKSFFKVTMLVEHDNAEILKVVFKDSDIDKECNYRIALTVLDPDEGLYAVEQLIAPEAIASSPISFQLSAKQFKKSVTDASHYSDVITFEKLGAHPLQITYNRIGVAYNEVYRTPEKIGLRSTITSGIFRCSVDVANIKSLASAMVTDTVKIFCRDDGDLLLKSDLDALEMFTFTAIERI